MKQNRKLTICAIALTAVLLSCMAYGQQTPQENAAQSANSWLALVDAGKYGQSWEGLAEYLKNKITKGQWEAQLKQVHTRVGALKSRKFASTQLRDDLHGLPAGQYAAVEYNTTFDKLAPATEVVALRLENARWRVMGYFVEPKGHLK